MKEINMKRVLLTVLFTLGLGVLLFVGWFIWAIVTDEPPQFFSLNNSKARYTIVKSSNMAQGWVEQAPTSSSDLQESRYYVEYRGDGVFADNYNKNFFRITVGNSKVELEPFIGKDVVITKGKFTSSSRQCIVDKCIEIYGPHAVLDIEGLKIAQ